MMTFQPGDIFAYRKSDALWALGISFGEMLAGADGRYVHVGIWDGTQEIAAYFNGVGSGAHLNAPCDVLRVKLGFPPYRLDYALEWLHGKVGKTPYAWWDLGWVWLMRRLGLRNGINFSDQSVICSWLVADFLQKAGVNAFPDRHPCEVMPGDFDVNQVFKTVATL
jgi:hypothetical protein